MKANPKKYEFLNRYNKQTEIQINKEADRKLEEALEKKEKILKDKAEAERHL